MLLCSEIVDDEVVAFTAVCVENVGELVSIGGVARVEFTACACCDLLSHRDH